MGGGTNKGIVDTEQYILGVGRLRSEGSSLISIHIPHPRALIQLHLIVRFSYYSFLVLICSYLDQLETKEGRALKNWERQLKEHARQVNQLAARTGKSQTSLLLSNTHHHRFKTEQRFSIV